MLWYHPEKMSKRGRKKTAAPSLGGQGRDGNTEIVATRRALLRRSAVLATAGLAGPLLAACARKAVSQSPQPPGLKAAVARALPGPQTAATITIQRAPQAQVTLTGALDATWNRAPAIDVSPAAAGVEQRGTVAESPTFTSSVYLQWDPQYFYALEQRVQAPPYANNGGNAQYYLGDALLLFFNTSNQNDGTKYGPGDYAFFLTPFTGSKVQPRAWDREGTSAGANEHAVQDVRMGYRQTATGYGFAVAIPWSELQASYAWTVQAGAGIGFGLGGTSRQGQTWGQILYDCNGNDQSAWGSTGGPTGKLVLA